MSRRLPLLLVADTSLQEALGSKFVRAAHALGLESIKDFEVSYSSPAEFYSPSMRHVWGKIFYRLADRRSIEWWGFQRRLLAQVNKWRPELVVVTGILPLSPKVFGAIRQNGGRVVNYLTDDPWNRIHRRRCFINNLALYDHIFSTKDELRIRLEKAGTPTTSWLPFAYDPALHRQPTHRADDGADVLFVGTGALERLAWLRSLDKLQGIKKRIHGNNWEKIPTPGWERREAVVGEEYCKALGSAKIVLGLLRQGNGDLSTDRSYEIGAIGACGLYQDTTEHRNLLPDYPDVGFFNDPSELVANVVTILRSPELQDELRTSGSLALRRPENTYAARLGEILEWGKGEE